MGRRTARRRDPPSTPRPCREPDCGTRIFLARQAGTSRWLPFEAVDREPFSIHAVGAWVVIEGIASKPRDLIEQWQATYEITETKARELLAGYPAHRIHLHEKADT